jgi:hypothetical protein
MKKFLVVLLALATILVLAPAAMADTIACSADTASPIVGGTVCTEGLFTFTFVSVSITPSGTDALYFNAGATGVSGKSATLAFTVFGGTAADFNLVYEVQGPAGLYTLDNSFAGGTSGDDIIEEACTGNPNVSCGTQLASFVNSTGGINVTSLPFASNGTFYISKDVSDAPYRFSEFNDSVELLPEPGSLVLFGTGLIGLAGLLRRKYIVSR